MPEWARGLVAFLVAIGLVFGLFQTPVAAKRLRHPHIKFDLIVSAGAAV